MVIESERVIVTGGNTEVSTLAKAPLTHTLQQLDPKGSQVIYDLDIHCR